MAENEEAFPASETPWRRDPSEVTSRLAAWASTAFGQGSEITNVVAPDNGMSSESCFFDVTLDGITTHYVARMAPLPHVIPVFQNYDIELQSKAMNVARGNTRLPIPEVTHLELDASILATPFLVMKRLPGSPPSDMPPYVFGGWVCDLTEDERRTMERNAIQTLVDLHELRPDTADLGFLARPDRGQSALDQHLGHERDYYEWARGDLRYPLIERTFEWLEANRPTVVNPTVLNWGDARIGNMLWEGPTPTAVLDWEMACLGPAEVDLAWMIFLHAFFQNLAETYGMPGLPDFMRRSEMAALYTELSGRTVEALEWFEVFAALRFASISIRTTTRGVAYGQMEPPDEPDDVIMFRGLLEQMLDGTYWDGR
ncbi:MAG: phosphotransferase family protein [Acidimicrobiales bacterium]